MKKEKLERIVKTYYDALEEGKILGRRCTACGHIEYPPYLACNKCGNLKTEWVEIPHEGVATHIMPAASPFILPAFQDRNGEYCVASVQVEDCDEFGTAILGMTAKQCEEIQDQLPVKVKARIVPDDGFKIALWELADADDSNTQAAGEAQADASGDSEKFNEVLQTVISCAAEAYGVDEDEITADTDIREDLSNESMKMIVLISGIEDELDVSIEIREAGDLSTIRDFTEKVLSKMED